LQLQGLATEELLEQRYEKYKAIGQYREAVGPKKPAPEATTKA
jgi:hypothetical protein